MMCKVGDVIYFKAPSWNCSGDTEKTRKAAVEMREVKQPQGTNSFTALYFNVENT
jgi:hypothetical protein